MPELPEVQSSVEYLKGKVLGRTFLKVWTDTPKMGVTKKSLNGRFEDLIIDKKIKNVKRRAKNIVFHLEKDLSLLIHYKMTGHLLLGKWKKKNGRWISEKPGPLRDDKMNQYIRFIFFLDNDKQLAFSDLRKFGKIELWKNKDLEEKLSKLGPEPFSDDFTLNKFKEMIKGRRKMIKPLIMDQKFLAGVGNIYASDALWLSEIHPETKANQLTDKEIEELYQSIKEVLKEGIKNSGDSMVDFRLPDGTRGNYQNKQKVYNKHGEVCKRCKSEKIKKIKVGGRGTYLCPNCQVKK
ncbi:MAG: bifunctional DNA-formamidopyrimidine glycosylase/DNA-(apurinic or apyrimidinic site) lyase [Patescibacteria group bacterium]